MRRALVLLGSFLRRDSTPLVALGLGLYLFEVLFVWIANALERSGGFRAIESLLPLFPSFVSDLIGVDVAGLLALEGLIGFGYFHPAVVVALVASAIVVGRSPIGELEAQRSDLLLARPVSRATFVGAGLLEVGTVAVALPAMMLLGTITGLVLVGKAGSIGALPLARLGVAEAALVLTFGTLNTAVAAISTRAKSYTTIVAAVAFVSFLVDFLARVWPPLRLLQNLSVFHYLQQSTVLGDAPMAGDLAVLAGAAVGFAAVAVVAFDRRDV